MAFISCTSLSKVFNLIYPFSVDIDIIINYRNFIPKLNLEHINQTQLKK